MKSQPRVLVAPSLLACDFSNLQKEVARAEAGGADWLHLDVMDGNFVDNISFGPAFVEAVARHATVPLDVHLMIERPDHYFPRFLPHAANVTVHVEAPHDVAKTLADIRSAGAGVGLSLNPDTPLSEVSPYLGSIDLLLVMTVHPGFGGQKFREETMEKVAEAAGLRDGRGLNFRIQVDGGINAGTAATSVAHGADVLVAGTSIFAAEDIGAAIRSMRATGS